MGSRPRPYNDDVLLDPGNAEIFADLAGQLIRDLGVARHRGTQVLPGISPP